MSQSPRSAPKGGLGSGSRAMTAAERLPRCAREKDRPEAGSRSFNQRMRPPPRSTRPSGIVVAAILLGLAGCGGKSRPGAGDGGGTGDRGGGETSPDGGGDDTGPDAAIDVLVDAGAEPGDAAIADAPASDAEPCWVPGGCQCGKLGQSCCSGAVGAGCSEPTTACAAAPGTLTYTCVRCGGPGEPCCAGNTCSNGGCCVTERLDGGDHSLCTASGAACPLATPATCGSTPAMPASCGACGSVGQPCCAGTPDLQVCTAPNTYCTAQSPGATCAACGAEGQPCCSHGISIGTGSLGVCNAGLHCPETSPATCQVLPIGCSDASCAAGTRCNAWSGRCEPDGGLFPPPGRDNGEPCSDDSDCRSATGVGAALVPACDRSDGRWMGGYCLSYCNMPPGGFWTNPLSRSNCPAGSVCLPAFQLPHGEKYGGCARECRTDSDCRVAEGYYCRRTFSYKGPTFSNGYCAPIHCQSRGCASLKCGC
jgi:hypothetical protein